MFFVCCAWIEERNPRVGLIACDICSHQLHHSLFKSHCCFASHFSPWSSLLSHLLKFLPLSFSTLVSPATFLPDHVSGSLVISKSTRGHREYCPLRGVSGPKLFYSPGTMTLPSSVYLLIDDCWKHQIFLHLLWCPRPVSEFANP